MLERAGSPVSVGVREQKLYCFVFRGDFSVSNLQATCKPFEYFFPLTLRVGEEEGGSERVT